MVFVCTQEKQEYCLHTCTQKTLTYHWVNVWLTSWHSSPSCWQCCYRSAWEAQSSSREVQRCEPETYMALSWKSISLNTFLRFFPTKRHNYSPFITKPMSMTYISILHNAAYTYSIGHAFQLLVRAIKKHCWTIGTIIKLLLFHH